MYVWINHLIVKRRAGWRLAELVPVAAAEEESAAVALRGAVTVEWGAPVDPLAQQGAARAAAVVGLNGGVRSWSSLPCRSARGICWSTAKFWLKGVVFSVHLYFYFYNTTALVCIVCGSVRSSRMLEYVVIPLKNPIIGFYFQCRCFNSDRFTFGFWNNLFQLVVFEKGNDNNSL